MPATAAPPRTGSTWRGAPARPRGWPATARRAVRERFRAFGNGAAASLRPSRDHGSRYASCHFQGESCFLGGEGSPAFVRELEGNGRAGRFVRAPKGDLPWVRRSATV